MTRKTWKASGWAILGLLMASCAQTGAAPPPSQATTAPAGFTSAQVQQGKTLFNENCTVCHQEGGKGQPGVAPSLTSKEFLAAASDSLILGTLENGREGTNMVSYREMLKPGEMTAILAYLRSFGSLPPVGPELDKEWQAMGDPHLGKRWYEGVCAGCHGPRGEGYEAGGAGTGIGKKGFLSKASDGFIRFIVKNGRSNTPMRGFSGSEGMANLSDQEIDDIISYLRILE